MNNFLSGWDVVPSGNQSTSGGKTNFTKFAEGTTRIRVLDNTPHLRWAHWIPQISRKITCAGFGCPIEELNKRSKAQGGNNIYDNSRAFSFNIWNLNENRHELMEEGVTFFDELKLAMIDAVEANPGIDISSFLFKVRKGTNSQRKATWRIDLEEVSEFTNQVSLVDRMEYFKPPTIEQVNQILAIDNPDKDERIARYVEIMGFGSNNNEEALPFEVEEV